MSVSGSASITISGATQGGSWIIEDFNYPDTTSLIHSTLKTADGTLAYGAGTDPTNGDNHNAQISLGDGGYGGRAHFMRYTVPAMFARYDEAGNLTNNSLCSTDRFINREMKLMKTHFNMKDLWVEVAARFSTDYGTNKSGICNGGFCGGCGVAARKFLLLWANNSARYDYVIGLNGRSHWSAHLDAPDTSHGTGRNEAIDQCTRQAVCSGLGWNCQFGNGGEGTTDTQCPTFPNNGGLGSLFDGAWHIFRCHFRLPSSDGQTDGIARIWVDGVKVKDVSNGLVNGHSSNNTTFATAWDHFQIGANSNSGWTKAGATEDYGYIHIYSANPGWV